MNISQIVVALQNAKGPDRKLDVEIAHLLGIKRTVDTNDPKKVIWLKPDGTHGKVLFYTRLVDSAIDLAHEIAPDNVGGCSWEKGQGTARINDGPYVRAASPALALCVAALQLLWVREKDRGGSGKLNG